MSDEALQPDWISGRDNDNLSNRPVKSKSSGSWATLGVSPPLVKALRLRGFKNPTPIQRAAIPSALSSPPRDVLGMARTGSGKTLAYLIPLLNRLGGVRQEGRGIRALIMCPSRELAVQVLKAGKDLSRSLASDTEDGHPLRWSLIMGGESLDAQFESLTSLPDIVIATPGRFLHLIVEMDLDLRTVETVIYDEADRLFEMGFELQLREILHRLPANRHSLLFSATLPTSLAEFAKAGLANPSFIRLDTEHRISPDLNLAFMAIKPDERDGALLVLLREVIGIATGSSAKENGPKAIIFASTKHHVEYLSVLLQAAGHRVSYIYGSLDQHARQNQLRLFRQAQTDLLVVTDVAARGLDIPAMGHVINYNFPSGVRIFVHRVGRTARAGQQGHAWSLVSRDDLPHLRDLEIFLERPLVNDHAIYGALPREALESAVEYIRQSLEISEPQLPALRQVMNRGQKMYDRSRSKASRESYKAIKSDALQGAPVPVHPAFKIETLPDEADGRQRASLLASIQAYNPHETIFEIGSRGQHAAALLMKQRRRTIAHNRVRVQKKRSAPVDEEEEALPIPDASTRKSYQDPAFFLPHENVETNREKGYSLREGASFAEQARSATLDLNADDGDAQRAQKASQLKWDRKKKRFVKGDPTTDGNQKMIRGESGALLPASFKSGRYVMWKQQSRKHGAGDSRADNRANQTSTKGIASAETILKERRQKEQRKSKNSRAPRKKR